MPRAKTDKIQEEAISVGARLRKAREDKSLSLEDVHNATKIHPNVLVALEEDKLESRLGMAYVKVFLKKYASYLGLDGDGIIREYLAGHALCPESDKEPLLERKPLPGEEKGALIRISIVVSAFLIWTGVLSYATLKFVDKHKHKDVAKEHNAIPAKTELAEVKKETTEEIRQEKKEEAKEVKKETVEKTEIEAEAYESKGDLLPIPKRRTITLTLSTEKDVWMRVMQDGELAFHGNLSKNSKETWQAKNEIRLTEIGRPEALKLSVNGQDIDLSGKRLGRNVLITHKGIDLEPKQ